MGGRRGGGGVGRGARVSEQRRGRGRRAWGRAPRASHRCRRAPRPPWLTWRRQTAPTAPTPAAAPAHKAAPHPAAWPQWPHRPRPRAAQQQAARVRVWGGEGSEARGRGRVAGRCGCALGSRRPACPARRPAAPPHLQLLSGGEEAVQQGHSVLSAGQAEAVTHRRGVHPPHHQRALLTHGGGVRGEPSGGRHERLLLLAHVLKVLLSACARGVEGGGGAQRQGQAPERQACEGGRWAPARAHPLRSAAAARRPCQRRPRPPPRARC